MNRSSGADPERSGHTGRFRTFPRHPQRLALVLLALWLVSVAASALAGTSELGRGADALARARREIGPTELVDDEGARSLRTAERHFGRARALLAHPAMAPAGYLPVAGRQLRSVEALAVAADRVAGSASVGAARTRRLLADQPKDGPARLAAAEELADVLADTERDLASVDLGPDRALVRPLAERRAAFAADLDEARQTVRAGRTTVETIARMLRGPKRYLLLAANNAEMRAGSGMFLSAGILETAGGDFELSAMERTGDLTLGPDGVPYPPEEPDLAARWGFLNPNREWRNLGTTARFSATAPLAARMWEGRTGEAVDGVLAVDVAALQAIVAATGPVEVDGRSLDHEAVRSYLLHDQYLDIDEGRGRRSSQAERREDLGALAAAATKGLQEGGFDTERLASGLLEAVTGRHLLAWARDPADQAGWVAAGAAGGLGEDDLLLSLLNRGGNKLDPFVRPEVDVVSSARGRGTRFELRVRLRNRVGEDAVDYVAGPGEGIDAPRGTYIGLLSLHLPNQSREVEVQGGPVVVAGGDGPTRVVAAEVVVPRGEERTVTVAFTLPAVTGELSVQPSARLPAARWRAADRTWTDRRPRTVRWQDGRIVAVR